MCLDEFEMDEDTAGFREQSQYRTRPREGVCREHTEYNVACVVHNKEYKHDGPSRFASLWIDGPHPKVNP